MTHETFVAGLCCATFVACVIPSCRVLQQVAQQKSRESSALKVRRVNCLHSAM